MVTLPGDFSEPKQWFLGGQELDGQRLFLAFLCTGSDVVTGVTLQLPSGNVISTVARSSSPYCFTWSEPSHTAAGIAAYNIEPQLSLVQVLPNLTFSELCSEEQLYHICSEQLGFTEFSHLNPDDVGFELQKNSSSFLNVRALCKSFDWALAVPSLEIQRVLGPKNGLGSPYWLHEPSGALLGTTVSVREEDKECEQGPLTLFESDGTTTEVAADGSHANVLVTSTGMVLLGEGRVRVFYELALRAEWIRCVVCVVRAVGVE